MTLKVRFELVELGWKQRMNLHVNFKVFVSSINKEEIKLWELIDIDDYQSNTCITKGHLHL